MQCVSDIPDNQLSCKAVGSDSAAFNFSPQYLGYEKVFWSALLKMSYQTLENDSLGCTSKTSDTDIIERER